ncbi:casein kinase II, regulatory subunit [Tribonema minus]|uniref:Casein kinase II subunit beta n=1 Tax=Tribonema minus TaxID=303371 RepID=A0A836CJ70_9STRA|nr:casein kinase II, regulatory subunit [Tribonema minus]
MQAEQVENQIDAAVADLEARTRGLTVSPAVNGTTDASRGKGAAAEAPLSEQGEAAAANGEVSGSNDDPSVEEEEADEDSSSEVSASDDDGSWISWFVSLRGNEFFCEIDEDYIQDDFNLTGLSSTVPYYEHALELILDLEFSAENGLTDEQREVVEGAAEMLYGLIHARFILTTRGMQGQSALPVGLSDLPRSCTVAVFCPKCHDVFHPKSARQGAVDGAYFGTSFPHLFLLLNPSAIPARSTQTYVPRIYGFKVHESSVYHRARQEKAAALNKSGKRRESRDSASRRASRDSTGSAATAAAAAAGAAAGEAQALPQGQK